MASHITGVSIVCLTLCLDADQKNVNAGITGLLKGRSTDNRDSPLKGPVTRKMFPFDDVIMEAGHIIISEMAWNQLGSQ